MAEEAFHGERYDKRKNMRLVPNWPNEHPVLVVAGESGQGKTWQLLNLMDSVLTSGGVAVFVLASGDANRDLQAASDVVWQEGFGRSSSIKISRLADLYRKVNQRHSEDWLTVCIDDVQEIREARQLVKQPWKHWGVRLALTVPSVVGNALDADQLEGVRMHKMLDFSATEVRHCLRRHSCDWGEVPEDVRDTLGRPFLAGLYCGVAKGEG
jgi:hypothetical protein